MPPKKARAAVPKKALQPGQPPAGADFSALVKKVNEIAEKTAGVTKLNATITGKIPAWKRWVGGEEEYDGTGLRDIVNANALNQNAIKANVDSNSQAILELRADVEALKEAPPARPFP